MKTKEFSLGSETRMTTELLGKSKEELRAFCVGLGEPAFRGAQIYHALYAERKFDVAQITNLPAALRARLAKETRVTLPEARQRFVSADGSVRYLFGLGSEEKDKELNAENTERTEKNSRERVSP
jgi:adenine C2-methylase RlmN of 23S rRNA A2503 and tRNA A37